MYVDSKLIPDSWKGRSFLSATFKPLYHRDGVIRSFVPGPVHRFIAITPLERIKEARLIIGEIPIASTASFDILEGPGGAMKTYQINFFRTPPVDLPLHYILTQNVRIELFYDDLPDTDNVGTIRLETMSNSDDSVEVAYTLNETLTGVVKQIPYRAQVYVQQFMADDMILPPDNHVAFKYGMAYTNCSLDFTDASIGMVYVRRI